MPMTQSTAKLALIALFLTSLLSCEQPAKKPAPTVTELAPVNTGKPSIRSLQDLGGLDIANGGGIPTHFSDNRYSPGEWVRITGKNLTAEKVSIDGKRAIVISGV